MQASNSVGSAGGSGGGNRNTTTGTADTAGAAGGAAQQPGSASGGFGFAGGSGRGVDGSNTKGGGGGGAGSAGENSPTGLTRAGNGGDGRASTITGTSVFYAAGGGGGGGSSVAAGGTGGTGGGGNGSVGQVAGGDGTDGLGSGGGGGGATSGLGGAGGAGGSGIVVVRYLGDPLYTGGTRTAGTGSAAGDTLHTFTLVGSDTLALEAGAGATLAGTLTGSGGFTWDSDATLTLSGANDYTGGTVVAAGRLSGNVWNTDPTHPNVVLTKTGSGTLELAGTTSNTRTSLVASAGTTVLNNSQSAVYEVRGLDTGATVRLAASQQVFSGDATATTGNIRMTGGTLDLDGYDQTINRLIGADNATAGTGTITSSSAATFTVGSNLAGRPSLFAGEIAGDLAVVAKGDNPITLSGGNTYAGTTTIQDAATQLRIGAGGTSGSLGGGAVSNAGELVFDRSDAIEVANAISGTGSLTQAGSGTLTLSGTNTYSGGTTILQGTLVGGVANIPGDISLDGNAPGVATLEFAQASEATYSGVISSNTAANTGSNIQPLNFPGSQDTGGSYVTVTAVPEPATLVLLAAAAGLAALTRRRR